MSNSERSRATDRGESTAIYSYHAQLRDATYSTSSTRVATELASLSRATSTTAVPASCTGDNTWSAPARRRLRRLLVTRLPAADAAVATLQSLPSASLASEVLLPRPRDLVRVLVLRLARWRGRFRAADRRVADRTACTTPTHKVLCLHTGHRPATRRRVRHRRDHKNHTQPTQSHYPRARTYTHPHPHPPPHTHTPTHPHTHTHTHAHTYTHAMPQTLLRNQLAELQHRPQESVGQATHVKATQAAIARVDKIRRHATLVITHHTRHICIVATGCTTGWVCTATAAR